MNQKHSNRRTAQQWQGLIEQQHKSGISQKAFCQLHDICLSTFSLWKRRLKQIDITPDQSSTSDTEWIEFPTHCDGAIPDKPLWDMELELPGGVILRMRR